MAKKAVKTDPGRQIVEIKMPAWLATTLFAWGSLLTAAGLTAITRGVI